MSPGPSKRPYHHGDLRSELVRASLEVMKETGVTKFSVAQAARAAGVSSAAPYRHFKDRLALLAACATVAASELVDRLEAAAEAAGSDPDDRFAATAGAYSRFVIENRVGLDLIYAEGLQDRQYRELHEQSRRLMELLIFLAVETSPCRSHAHALDLMEAQFAVAHGYAVLQVEGGYSRSRLNTDDIEERSTAAAHKLLRGTTSETGLAVIPPKQRS